MVKTRDRLKKKPGEAKKGKNINDALHKIYYNYGEEGALTNNKSTLLRLVRKKHPTAGPADVDLFLTQQPGYTVHKRIHKLQFPRRSIHVSTSGVRADADLIELGDLAEWNDGYRYVFTVVDAFSRYLWAKPTITKEANSTAVALQSIIKEEGFSTISLYTDGGREFSGGPFQSVLKGAGMKHRVCASDDFHCPFVERVIRTVKEKLFQAMTTGFSRRWVDLLPKVIKTYNNTIHSSIKMRPVHARDPANFLTVLKQVRKKKEQHWRPNQVYKFRKGDYVRILLGKGGPLGKKGYLPRYSWEIFKIKKLANDRPSIDGGKSAVPAYILEDLENEVIENAIFYENELSKVDATQLERAAPVREILEEDGDRVKVWFQGFPRSSAKWILRKNLL